MTCIVGLRTADGRVIIGGDSCSADTQSNGHRTTSQEPKVFKRDGFIMGYAGSWRFGQILRYVLVVPPHGDQSHEAYMFRTFMPALRTCLFENGLVKKENNLETCPDGVALFAYGGELWAFYSDFQLHRTIDGMQAVGSGQMTALAALHGTARLADRFNPPMTPEERIEVALSIAAGLTPFVSAPWVIESST